MRIAFVSRSSDYRPFAEQLAARLPAHEVLFRGAERPWSLDGVEALLTAGGVIGREVLESSSVGFIQTIGTGYDNVDLPVATRLGVWVSHMRASATGNAESVAEHAVLLLLALARRMPLAQQSVKQGSSWAQPRGTALLGKVACIVGLGDVGTALAVRLRAFGIRLVGVRDHASRGGPEGVQVFGADELHQSLREADFVLLAARASPLNGEMMDAEAFAAMKPGALFVNVARGSLVKTAALEAALRSGHLGGAGLDVFWEEPVDPRHPLLQLPQVIATPHVAGITDVTLERSMERAAHNMDAYSRGLRPDFLLNAPSRPRKALR